MGEKRGRAPHRELQKHTQSTSKLQEPLATSSHQSARANAKDRCSQFHLSPPTNMEITHWTTPNLATVLAPRSLERIRRQQWLTRRLVTRIGGTDLGADDGREECSACSRRCGSGAVRGAVPSCGGEDARVGRGEAGRREAAGGVRCVHPLLPGCRALGLRRCTRGCCDAFCTCKVGVERGSFLDRMADDCPPVVLRCSHCSCWIEPGLRRGLAVREEAGFAHVVHAPSSASHRRGGHELVGHVLQHRHAHLSSAKPHVKPRHPSFADLCQYTSRPFPSHQPSLSVPSPPPSNPSASLSNSPFRTRTKPKQSRTIPPMARPRRLTRG